MAEIENEFSDAFSTAFDGVTTLDGTPSICYPPGADWGCAYTAAELIEMTNDANSLAAMKRSEAYAWLALGALTGWQIGMCPVVVRPCAAGCGPAGTWMVAPAGFSGVRPGLYSTFMPHISASGAWVNGCGCSSGDCGCSSLSEVILPGFVGKVEEVWLNGEVLNPTAYRIDNGNRLVRTDGGTWPACQDLAQSAHGADAFSVTYYRGAAPNETILWAVGRLAVEFYRACLGQECALPHGTVSVSRQGVAVEIEAGMFPNGKTNIPEVDTLIQVYNPKGLTAAPVIASPDTRRVRMTTAGMR